jgi:hypothetical protein
MESIIKPIMNVIINDGNHEKYLRKIGIMIKILKVGRIKIPKANNIPIKCCWLCLETLNCKYIKRERQYNSSVLLKGRIQNVSIGQEEAMSSDCSEIPLIVCCL